MLTNLISKAAKTNPEHTAIICGANRLSYKELFDQIQIFSIGLKKIGAKEGETILIMLPNCPELVVCFYAVANIGARLVFLPLSSTQAELQHYLKKFKPTLILTDQHRNAFFREATNNLKQDIPIVNAKDLISQTKTKDINKQTALSRNHKLHKGEFVFFRSSGSTGDPKFIIHTQKRLSRLVIIRKETAKLTPTDIFLCVSPIDNPFTIGGYLVTPLGIGATVVFLEEAHDNSATPVSLAFQRPEIIRLIQQEKVTVISSLPWAFKLLSDMSTKEIGDVSSLRLCFSGGSTLSQNIFESFQTKFGLPLRQTYGCAEVIVAAINMENHIENIGPVGRPAFDVKIRIINAEEETVPRGVVGRIQIKSPVQAKQYYDDPQLSTKSFKNGWFLTDDLGSIDDQGRLHLNGRVSDWIDIGGYKIDPHEIEQVLLTHKKIKEAVVVGGEGQNHETILKAVLITNSNNHKLSTDELQTYCRNKLSPHKVPQLYEFRDTLPRTTSGKVKRHVLTAKNNTH